MGVWRGLAANTALLRVLAAYTLFTLTDTEPTAKARLAATLAERLHNR